MLPGGIRGQAIGGDRGRPRAGTQAWAGWFEGMAYLCCLWGEREEEWTSGDGLYYKWPSLSERPGE
jgi:hypothetical protein